MRGFDVVVSFFSRIDSSKLDNCTSSSDTVKDGPLCMDIRTSATTMHPMTTQIARCRFRKTLPRSRGSIPGWQLLDHTCYIAVQARTN